MKIYSRNHKTEDKRQRTALEKSFFCLLPFVFCFLILLVWANSIAYGQATTIKDILTHPDKFDKTIVEIQAEAVGEVLKDKNGSWINVSCDGFNLGVYFQDSYLVNRVNNLGSYKIQGDILKIKGTFYKSCPFHFERDIHASSLEVIKTGQPRKEKVSLRKQLVSFTLAIICLTLAFVSFIKLRYARRD